MNTDEYLAEITAMQENFLRLNRANRRWIIVEVADGFEVHEHTIDGVAPPSQYPTKRLAASRLLQLMGIGPVAPQAHPEEVCVGSVTVEDE